jgi:hypothetical protein
MNSLYFSIVTTMTIGYGDITPVTIPEKIFVSFMGLFITGLFSYSINEINLIV